MTEHTSNHLIMRQKAVLKCFFCDGDIYEGDDYYVLNGFDCCEECLDVHFKFTAEAHDYEAEMADLEYHDLRGVIKI